MTQSNETNSDKSKRNKIIAIGIGAVAIVATAITVPAIADSRMYQHAKIAMSDSGDTNIHKAGWGSRHKGSGLANMSDADIEKRVSKMVAHLSIEIDATDEQEKKITEIAVATAIDMKPLRAEFRSAGMELANLLTAENVDRTAIERIRADRLAAADEVSKKLVDAVAEVSEVLTADQRAKLADHLDRFKSKRGH